jgi:phage baseplate assembly protein W
MNTILSDFNKPRYSPQVISERYYTDISDSVAHPISGQAILSTDIDAIKNSIRNIILTPIGSRAFNPSFGTKIQTLLFEHPTPVTAIAIRSEIKIALQRLEPRVKVTNIEVFQREFDTDYEVSITFIAGYAPDEEISFTLNRLR